MGISSEDMKTTTLLRQLISEALLTESVPRHCMLYKASNGKWYLELAPREYFDEETGEGDFGDGERETAFTYGPFSSEESVEQYLQDNFSNPGSSWTDDTGKAPPPTKSPNGQPVKSPSGGYGASVKPSYSDPAWKTLISAPAPAAKKPAALPPPPAAPKPSGKKTTYKIYGRYGDSPACTRVKGKVYGGSKTTKFRAGQQAEVTPDGDKLTVRDPSTGHTQSWSVKESLVRFIREYAERLKK